jgi:hypothetical protein
MNIRAGQGIVVAINSVERTTMRKLLMAAAMLTGLLLSPGVAAADTTPDSPLDARAAAAREGGITQSDVGVQAAWFSGTVAPGATQGWYWNNANPFEAAYKVGFNPVGATSGKSCRFETVNTIYQRYPNGERKFFFTIKNVGSIACGTTILLVGNIGNYIGYTGNLSPGQTQTWFWNFYDFTTVQLPGITPTGAVGAPCQIELLGSSTRNPEAGHREFYFTFRNVGSITCGANLYLGSLPQDTTWLINPRQLAPGETHYGVWNNANPLNAVYVPIAHSFIIGEGEVCHLEVVRSFYSQVINASGFPERKFHLEVRNIGPDVCRDVFIDLATIAA